MGVEVPTAPPAETVPPCRVCKSNAGVLVYPDDHTKTICPECCDKDTDDKSHTTGHDWWYDRWERGKVCLKCGIPMRDTRYHRED